MNPKDNPTAPAKPTSRKGISLVSDTHKGIAYVYVEPTSAGSKKRKEVKWSVPGGSVLKFDGIGRCRGGSVQSVRLLADDKQMDAEVECNEDFGCVEYELFYLDANGVRQEAYGRKLQGNDPAPGSKYREGDDALFVNPPPIIVFP